VVGAVESAVTVKFELEDPPALFEAVTLFVPGSAATAVKEYVRVAPEPDADQFVPIDPAVGNV
jgi:hypothetical protein